jgi:hypothetical protein
MTAQHARHLLHRLDTGAHDLDTPFVGARPGPVDRAILSERLKALAEQHGAHGPQVTVYEFAEPRPLCARLIRRPFQEQPAGLGQERLSPLLSQGVDLRAAHLIDRIAHVLGALLNPIQDNLDLHHAVRLQEVVCVGTYSLKVDARDASPSCHTDAREGARAADGIERRPPRVGKPPTLFNTFYTHHRTCSLFSGGPSVQERLFITVERGGVVLRVEVGAHNLLGRLEHDASMIGARAGKTL